MPSSKAIFDKLVSIEEGLRITAPREQGIVRVYRWPPDVGTIVEPYSIINQADTSIVYEGGQYTQLFEVEIALYLGSFLEGDRREQLWEEAWAFIDEMIDAFTQIANIGLGGAGGVSNSTLTKLAPTEYIYDQADSDGESVQQGELGVVGQFSAIREIGYAWT